MLAQMGSGGPILGYLRSQAPIETITRLLVNQGSQLLVFSKEAILFLIYLLADKANYISYSVKYFLYEKISIT